MVFGGAALLILALAAVLRAKLPVRVPSSPLPYSRQIGSLWTLFKTTPVLRSRAA